MNPENWKIQIRPHQDGYQEVTLIEASALGSTQSGPEAASMKKGGNMAQKNFGATAPAAATNEYPEDVGTLFENQTKSGKTIYNLVTKIAVPAGTKIVGFAKVITRKDTGAQVNVINLQLGREKPQQ